MNYKFKVGDLVKLNVHSHFTSGINDIIGIRFGTIGIVLQEECEVYSVMFPTDKGNMIRSFMIQDLEIVQPVCLTKPWLAGTAPAQLPDAP